MPGFEIKTRLAGIGGLGGLAAVFTWLLITASASAAPEDTALFPLTASAHAFAVTDGPDGNLWFVGSNFARAESEVGRVAPDGQMTEFPLSVMTINGDPLPAGIVTGSDGNLWFTEHGANKIGRITTNGDITQFPLPGSNGQPNAIAAGPDGNLWFTDGVASKIGRVTPTGGISEFPLHAGRQPAGIVTGPDGNLWFTEHGANRIGRITTAGVVSEFRLPGVDKRPDAIVAGPDGNLWFTEEAARQIGRITPTGAIAQFPVPTLMGTEALAVGPDGNLWFTSSTEIGSISPSGQVGQLSCVDPLCDLRVYSLAAGPEGAMWFSTSTQIVPGGGGGGVQTWNLTHPGYVGKFFPAPLTTAISARARSVVGRRTDLRLSCEAPSGCHGVLRLIRLAQVYPGHPGTNARTLVLGRGRYELVFGESQRIPLRLTRRATEILSRRGSLSAWATAGLRHNAEAIKLVVLHRAVVTR